MSSNDKDRTPDIISKVVQVAEAAAFGIPPVEFTGSQKTPPTSFFVPLLIDPFNERSVNGARERLKVSSNKIHLNITRADGSHITYETRDEIINAAINCNSGLCFRFVVPIIVSVCIDNVNILNKLLLTLKDQILVGRYDIVRGPCINRQTDITLDKGVVTKYVLDKPGDVLGFIQIHFESGNEILIVPGSLLTIKTERLNDEGAYLDAQTALLTAQANLLAAQAKAAGAKAQ